MKTIDRTPNTGDKSTCHCHAEIWFSGAAWVHSEVMANHRAEPLTCPVEGCGWRPPFHVETSEDWTEMLGLHAGIAVHDALDANAPERMVD